MPDLNLIKIKIESEINKKKWTDFLISTDNLNLFTSIEYYNLLHAKFFFITAYDERDILVGGCICRIRGGVFPFSIFSKCIWIESGIVAEKSNPQFEKEIKERLLRYIEIEARKRRCVLIKFNHWCYDENPEIFLSNNFEITYDATFVSYLDLSVEELYSKLDRNTKAAINKAKNAKLNFSLAKTNDISKLDEFYEIYRLTQERAIKNNKNISMTLKPLELIKGILFSENLNCYFAYTSLADKLAAGIILIKRNSSLIGYIAASDIELNRQHGASSLLFWESLLWAKEHGLKYFDFGGVTIDPKPDDPAYGVYRFKKNFGGELKKFPIGQKVLSPFREKIFKRLLDSRSTIRLFMRFSKKF